MLGWKNIKRERESIGYDDGDTGQRENQLMIILYLFASSFQFQHLPTTLLLNAKLSSVTIARCPNALACDVGAHLLFTDLHPPRPRSTVIPSLLRVGQFAPKV